MSASALAETAEPTVPAAFALHLAAGILRCGGSDAQLLTGLDASLDDLSDPRARLTFGRWSTLIQRAIALSGEPALGARMGATASISQFGVLGFAAMSAPTLREAVGIATRFTPARTDIVRYHFDVGRSCAIIELEELHPFDAVRDFVVCDFMFGLLRAGELFAGRALPSTLELACPEPPYSARLSTSGSLRLRFGRAQHRLSFAADLLDLPILSADPAAHRAALELCERDLIERAPGAPWVERVAGLMLAAEGGVRSPAEIARLLGMAERTLQRRLAEQRTSYSQLLERRRRTHAIELLRTQAPVEEIAARLGYEDPANFTRAFRRWTGRSPRDARKQERTRKQLAL